MIKKINIRQEGVESPSFTSIDEQYAFAHRLTELAENASEDSVIDAQVYIPECAPSDKKKVNDRFGDVIKVDESCIQFEDPEVKRVLVSSTNPRIDANGDGKITVAEAEAATSMPVINNNLNISSFNEINLFSNIISIPENAFFGNENMVIDDLNLPNLTSIGLNSFRNCKSIKKISNLGKIKGLYLRASDHVGVFTGCTSLEEVTLPLSCTVLGTEGINSWYPNSGAFSGCINLRTINNMEQLEYVNRYSFAYTAYEGPVVLPNLISCGNAFWNSKVKRIENLGKITTLCGFGDNWSNTISDMPELTYLCLPDTVQDCGGFFLRNCPKLNTIVMKPINPPAGGGYYWGNPPLSDGIYVPDASVDAYKTADGWSAYASKIKGFSEAPVEMREEYGF